VELSIYIHGKTNGSMRVFIDTWTQPRHILLVVILGTTPEAIGILRAKIFEQLLEPLSGLR